MSLPSELNIEGLRYHLYYNPNDGKLYWKVPTSNKVVSGQEAGYKDSLGYYRISFRNKRYLTHRVAWALYHGVAPPIAIDHLDGDPGNNRIDNLRLANQHINLQNQRKPRGNNTSGYLGVSPARRGKFRARIVVNGRQRQLGEFRTAREAHDAYVDAKRELHEGNTL